MTQVDHVRRRLVYALYRREVDEASERMNWDRDLIVDGLLLCDGEMHHLNEHWRTWRRNTPGPPPRGRIAQHNFHKYLVDAESLRKTAAELRQRRA